MQHESDNVFYASPRFDATGNVVYFHRRAAIIQNGSFTGNDDALERLDLRTGERKRLVKDGADPTISPDGRTLIYVHLKDGQVDALWRADIDGANARPLLQTRDTFWYLQAPRFSPERLRRRVLGGRSHRHAWRRREARASRCAVGPIPRPM